MIKVFAAGAGQSIEASIDIYPRKIYLVAGSVNATAVVYSKGVAKYPIAALAGTMGLVPGISGGNEFAFQMLAGPVTCDVVGTGAQLVVEY